ncbi:MAG: RraA family protein [candidate division NC10 bacterium]|nr:RraA family protein [candidate division NC10 bacterium]MBI2458437.1 RraA family protein [candidate division NC10 bacterium]MBI3086744.1 RraA family protein [candidate division NC10 bacterium]
MGMVLSAEQLEELRSVDSPTVANAIEAFKVRDDTQGFMGMDIPCLTPEFGVMVGYAVTATADSMTPGRARDRKGHMRLFDAIAASPKPAVLVVQDVGPKRTHACFLGDVIASLSSRLGAIGIVTDGGVRDLDGVRPLGFHIFAAGLVVAHGTFNIVDVGIPVEVSGTRVQLGDLIHGDSSGVTTVPLEIAEKLYAQCQKVREREIGLRDYAHSREFTLEGLRAKLLGR